MIGRLPKLRHAPYGTWLRSLKNHRHFKKASTGIGVILFATAGTILLFRSHASTPFASLEPENGGLSRPDLVTSDTSASGGKAVKFGQSISAQGQMFITAAELMAKPMSGEGWTLLKSKADLASYGTVTLADQNSFTQSNVLAGALVYARTGNATYKDKVISHIRQVCGTEPDTTTNTLLPVTRTLYSYVVSADLVQMPYTTTCNNGQTWQAYLESIRAKVIGAHGRWNTLEVTSVDNAGNWGAYALSTHLAVSYALNDTAAVQRDTDIFKRILGDTTSPAAAFLPTASYKYNNNGATWDMTPTLQRGINPYSATDVRSGAIISEALDGTSEGVGSVPCCTVQPSGVTYQEEARDGFFSTMQLLRAHGVDLTTFQDSAAKRAFHFYISNGGPSASSSKRYLPYFVNYLYGTTYPTVAETVPYRHMGYGSWLFTR